MSDFMTSYRLDGLAAAAETALADFGASDALNRLWSRDATLWKTSEDHVKIISNSLGWLDVIQHVRPHIGELKALADSVRQAGFTHCVLLGMGGSSLCTEVVRLSDLPNPSYPTMLVLDSTVPATIERIQKSIDPAKTLFLVASKSGGTTETASFYAYFLELVKGLKGDKAGENFVAITDHGTKMEASARADGFRDVRINPSDIGGRYSALSYFGLLPAALMGVDLNAYLDHAEAAQASCRPDADPAFNPGLQLGAALGGLAGRGRDKVTLVTPEPLGALGLWIEQLIAESTGKEDKGILPVAGEPLGTPEVYGNDRVFVRVRTAGSNDPRGDARLAALADAGHPVLEHILPGSINLGGEFFRWEVATALAGRSLGIDPFDQPNVQESKDYTRDLLVEFEQHGALTEPEVIADFGALVVSADAANKEALKPALGSPNGRDRVLAVMKAHLGRTRAGDYVAFTQYFDESEPRDEAILGMRVAVRDARKVATTTGYGPRFLHSTGQLHKGGSNNGVFVQLTADDGAGVPIPGQPYDFATLVKAQALGDFQALSAHGRRALRIHLGPDVERGLSLLREIVAEALA